MLALRKSYFFYLQIFGLFFYGLAQAQDDSEMLENFFSSIESKSGTVKILSDQIRIDLPENMVFLDSENAKRIIVDYWGNLEDNFKSLGIIIDKDFKKNNFVGWAFEINYENTGYVSDQKAHEINYDDILKKLKTNTEKENKYRIKNKLPEVKLIGWAKNPFYDFENKKLHWAKEYKFDNAEENTLNYDFRILGRSGVLSLNAIAPMSLLNDIEKRALYLTKGIHFEKGFSYKEFNPKVDKMAAYGISALVMGKVAGKLGIFKLLLKTVLALKKLLIVGAVLIAAFIGQYLSHKKQKED